MEKVADYAAYLSAELSEWDRRLAQLRVRAERAPAPVRLNLFSDMELLELRRKVAEEQIRELRNADGAATDEQLRALERIWADLRGALRDLYVKIG